MCTIFFKQTIVNLEGVEKLAQYVGQGSVYELRCTSYVSDASAHDLLTSYCFGL